MRLATLLLTAVSMCASSRAEDDAKARPPLPMLESRTYALENVAATMAAKTLNDLFVNDDRAIEVDGAIVRSSLVIVPMERTNSLIVLASPDEHTGISETLAALDKSPAQIVIQCKITVIDENGKRRIVSRPQIVTLDGQEASIEVDSGGESIRVDVIPRVVRPAADR